VGVGAPIIIIPMDGESLDDKRALKAGYRSTSEREVGRRGYLDEIIHGILMHGCVA
jgi:hypothetical protein